MQNLRTRLHTAKTTLRGYTFKRARALERERFALQRKLSALQNRFLELGLQASTCAREREAALQQARQTQVYLHPQPETLDQTPTQPPRHLELNKKYFEKPKIWSEYLNTFQEIFTPYTRLLETEIAALRGELSSLSNACQQLEERANELAGMRKEAVGELQQVRAQIGSLGVPVTESETPDPRIAALEQALQTERAGNAENLHAATQKLHRTQAEKADLQIRIADEESRVADLQAQRAQLGDEFKQLNEQLARAEIQRNAGAQENRSLGEQLALARRQQAGSEEQVNVLEKRCSALEKQIADARRHIEELELALAEAAYRQEITDKQNAAHSLSLGQLQDRLAQTAADNMRLSQQLQTRPDSRAQPGHHPVRWTRVVAGFVFLLGILASAGKLWQSADTQPPLVGVSKDVDTQMTAADSSAADPGEAAPTPREKVGITAMETVDVGPAGGVSRNKRPVSPAAQRTKQIRLPFGRNAGADRVTRTRGAHSRTWIMDQGDSKSARAKACEDRGLAAEECAALEENLLSGSVIRLPGGIQYTVLQNGFGTSPGIDDTVIVNYRGMLLDGQVFDSSTQQGGAVSFRLDEVIDGLQDVLQYMEEGAKWEVYIPGDLAFKKPARYGGQTLVFELELVSVQNGISRTDMKSN